MSVDAIVSTLAVMPKQDTQGNTGRNPGQARQEKSGAGRFGQRHPRGSGVDAGSDESHPLVNSYGQVIGQTVSITA